MTKSHGKNLILPDLERSILVVVDAQVGFVTPKIGNPIPAGTIERLEEFIKFWDARQLPIVFAQFINERGSFIADQFPDLGMYDDEQAKKEFEERKKLEPDALPDYEILRTTRAAAPDAKVFEHRGTFNCFEPPLLRYMSRLPMEPKTVLLGGFDTDTCVRHSAETAATNCALAPLVVRDLCFSAHGSYRHEATISGLKRTLGDRKAGSPRDVITDSETLKRLLTQGQETSSSRSTTPGHSLGLDGIGRTA